MLKVETLKLELCYKKMSVWFRIQEEMSLEEKHMELFCLVMTETIGGYPFGSAKTYEAQSYI